MTEVRPSGLRSVPFCSRGDRGLGHEAPRLRDDDVDDEEQEVRVVDMVVVVVHEDEVVGQ